MKPNPAIFIAAVAVIGAAGFFAGRLTLPEAPESGSVEDRAAAYLRGASRSGSGAESGNDRQSSSERGGGRAEMSGSDRLSHLESIVRGENALDRNRALLAFIDQLGPGDFEEAIAHFRTLGITESRMGEYSLLLTAWAKVDPTAALAYARENTRGGFARDTILASWATNDPDAALRWAEANHEGEGANPYLIGVIRGIAESDPGRATELLAGMPFGGDRGAALQGVLPHILKQGFESASAWITALEDPRLRNGALGQAWNALASQDPEGTVQLLRDNPGDTTSRRMDDVFSLYARQDRQAAMNLFQTLPPGAERSNALRGLVNETARNDPHAAESLMNQYPNDVNDPVVSQLAWNTIRTQPEIAVNNLSRISNEEERNRMYRRMLGRWIRQDTAAAQAWLQNNVIPDAVQGHVYNQLNEAQQ